MKKLQFESHEDLKKAISLLEQNEVEFTWDMYDTRHFIHLGHVNIDHVKLAMASFKIPYKIIDYS
ncbi:hypothetical protein CEE37_03835 [candidate division LCP-89 bacterium B3_LCP]|uniref:Uncharacterized protein n=1 Tax=candidate division LCP-89 bacterium B3_LCP TaxID=2012998 RepID=A0A532V3Z2_UNCL8|nr:MAG: hypothetical protein CEE37_03835 [candidate division LCP-89 bacterium B3_LCP]